MVPLRVLLTGCFLGTCGVQLVTGFVQCPSNYVPVDSFCFRFYTYTVVSWNEARQRCENEGAHLAVLDTVAKRKTVEGYVTRKGISKIYWLDGVEPNNDGHWIWSSNGKPVNSGLWAPGQPDNYSGEDCMHIWVGQGFNDIKCDNKYPFICESYPVSTWGSWTSWSTCSKTCGTQGLRSRTRVCDNPAPVGAGNPCPGADRQTEVCFPPPCPTCQVHSVPGATSSISAARIYENEYVRYYCLPEHTLVSGSLIRTCQADGTLTNEEPQCKKCCGKARFIVNGYPDTSATLCYGDHVNYLCGRGYKSSNSTPIVCSSPYEWKYIPLPKCEPDGSCSISDVPVPDNGFASCSGSELNKVCYIRCDKGYNYMSDRSVFECGLQTEWGWKVRDKSGKYTTAENGECKVTDGQLVKIMLGISGPVVTMASIESDEVLKQKIISEMKKELRKLNVCTDPCEIKDIQIKRMHASSLRRAISQEKLFRMTINLYAAVPKGPLATQQSATVALSKNLRHLSAQATAIKSALVSHTISLQIEGVIVPVKGDNIRVSKPSFVCSPGSIRKMFNCLTCPEGTYHDVDEEKCAACPFGQYQDEVGQLTCKQCPNDTTTDRIGVKNVSKCRTYEGCSCGIHPCILNGTDFICDCLPGYEANMNGTCTDINECLEDVCPVNARCVNKEGSYRCECLPGFQGGSCVDIDECIYPNACPSSGMQCINTVGSYNCTCNNGLYGDNCDKRCPDKFIETDKRCLFVSAAAVTHSNASQLCGGVHSGAHLIDIKDKVTYKSVDKYLHPPNSYWMGLNDKEQEGTFVYSDGSKVDTLYNEWGTGLTTPASNDRTKNCAVMDGNAAFQWRVVPCDELNYAVCEFDKV